MAQRRLPGGLILCALLTVAQAAEPPTSVVLGTPPQPNWVQLSLAQKTALAPLANEWDMLNNLRRRQWLGIADRFPSMKPDEQQRTQDRMREWVSLTPEQRSQARSSYKDFKQLPADQKQRVKQKWEAYSSLPEEEKQRLRESGKSARLLAPQPSAEALSPAAPAPGEAAASTRK